MEIFGHYIDHLSMELFGPHHVDPEEFTKMNVFFGFSFTISIVQVFPNIAIEVNAEKCKKN